MFIVPNPPKKKGGKKAKKGKQARRTKRTATPWSKTISRHAKSMAKKQGITESEAKKLLAGYRESYRGKYITKRKAASLRSKELKSKICHPEALAKAMRSYCAIHPRHSARKAKGKGKKHSKRKPASKAAAAPTPAQIEAAEAAQESREALLGMATNPRRRGSMRKHKFGYRAKARNIGEFLTMNPATPPLSASDIFSPSRTLEAGMGSVPFVAGAAMGALATSFATKQSWMPGFFKGGLGSYLLGGGIGLGLGALAGRVVDRNIGRQIMLGAATGVVAMAVNDAVSGGLKALAPRGISGLDELLGCQGMGCTNMSDDFDGLSGLGDLGDMVTPAQVGSAIQMEGNTTQYPVPMNPQSQYEASVLSEVISDSL